MPAPKNDLDGLIAALETHADATTTGPTKADLQAEFDVLEEKLERLRDLYDRVTASQYAKLDELGAQLNKLDKSSTRKRGGRSKQSTSHPRLSLGAITRGLHQ